MTTRRRFLRAGLAAVAGLTGCAAPGENGTMGPVSTDTRTDTPSATDETSTTGRKTTEPESSGLPLRLETVTTAPSSPLAFAEASDGTRYVADRPGQIYALRDGSAEVALDIADSVVTGGERGLLGLALHPRFGSNRRLYVRYSSPPRDGTPSSYSHTFVLAEFRAGGDGTVNPDTERTVLEIPEPQRNHNSGPIAFGPDGYLYVGVGDGGAGDDVGTGHVEDWYEANPGGNGQDVTENLLGSLLRIDVDSREGGKAYAIPEDNPLVGTDGLPEHYAWGFRNPWGISFDVRDSDDSSSGDGVDLYVADVGQNRFEEVDRVEKGGNYGWNVTEGTSCFRADECPTVTSDGERLRDPVIEYPHSGTEVSGVAVVGGHVYRGDAIPGLKGQYVFGDLSARGRLFVSSRAEEGLWPTRVLEVAEADRSKLGRLFAFGRDGEDGLYALTGSGVHRLAPSE